MDSEYKEGREYVLKQFIKEGSYGEVHTAEDVMSGFKFAAKKVIWNRLFCLLTWLKYVCNLSVFVASFSQRLP